jgi:hypothetical protein
MKRTRDGSPKENKHLYIINNAPFFNALVESLGYNGAEAEAASDVIRNAVVAYAQENASYLLDQILLIQIKNYFHIEILGQSYEMPEIPDSIVMQITSRVLNRVIHIVYPDTEIINIAQNYENIQESQDVFIVARTEGYIGLTSLDVQNIMDIYNNNMQETITSQQYPSTSEPSADEAQFLGENAQTSPHGVTDTMYHPPFSF